jgi:hypothetical protein
VGGFFFNVKGNRLKRHPQAKRFFPTFSPFPLGPQNTLAEGVGFEPTTLASFALNIQELAGDLGYFLTVF